MYTTTPTFTTTPIRPSATPIRPSATAVRPGPARRGGRAGRALLTATLALGVGGPLLVACGDDEPTVQEAGAEAPVTTAADAAPSNVLDLVTRDHSFEAAVDTVAAGPVTVRLTNEGEQPHQVHLAKVAPGVTAESFIETFETEGEPAAMALVEWAGGVNGVEPGATGEATSVLEEGDYLLICFLPTPGPDSKAHLVEGMVGELTVVDTGGRVPEPSASTEIGLADYSVAIPEGFDGGDVVVRNEGREDHELILMRFDDGKGLPDLLAWQEAGMPAERPFEYAGGTGTIPPGAEIWTSLDLEPGDYIALCVIPGPDGAPHVEMGMLTPFTIS